MNTSELLLDDDLNEAKHHEMYSPTAIIWYSVVFTPFVGALLFFVNLLAVKRGFLGIILVAISLVYSAVVFLLVNLFYMPRSMLILVVLFNLAGGNILAVPLWKRIIGKIKYHTKNPWMPLAILLSIYILVIVVRFFFLHFDFPQRD